MGTRVPRQTKATMSPSAFAPASHMRRRRYHAPADCSCPRQERQCVCLPVPCPIVLYGRPDVLVQVEAVVLIPPVLDRHKAVPHIERVDLLHPSLALIAEEVDVHALRELLGRAVELTHPRQTLIVVRRALHRVWMLRMSGVLRWA